MATTQPLISKSSLHSKSLLTKLAEILPQSAKFKIYHLSTPPTKTSSLYSAPPNTRPDRTYCESHFLTVSIHAPTDESEEQKDVLIFAIEILIYSTAHDNTFFVSKADSTGFLHLLGLPKGTPSPIRSVSATFLIHLLEQHQRPNIRNVVSLFARAQDQYLFPGSVEYSGKHVLDDRGLVRWWCRVLDPLITTYEGVSSPWESVKGFLIIPGLDKYETSSYPPRKPGSTRSWTIGDPLKQISRHGESVPPRCLIPHYPDDPKARFLDELDEEISQGKGSSDGQWKGVKSIDQFWEMMEFRQECSAGRLVGFIWIVFEPKSQPKAESQNTATSIGKTEVEEASSEKPPHINTRPRKTSAKPKGRKLTGPIIPRKPRIKTSRSTNLTNQPESTPYYNWLPSGRGQILVSEADYKRSTELLLRLDFADLELASSSTARWINEVRAGASSTEAEAWGQEVIGTKITEIQTKADVGSGVATLNVGLVRKKRKPGDEEEKNSRIVPETGGVAPVVNVLTAGMVRKKPKV